MSFFDDNKKVGLALIIIGIVGIVIALVRIVVAFDHTNTTANVIIAVGALIFGVLILLFGLNTRKGSNDKVAILSGLFRVLGIGTIISGICGAIGTAIIVGVGTGIVSGVLDILFGLILLWASFKVAGGNKNVIGKILWILLVIIFLILAILAIVGFFAVFAGTLILVLEGINSICWFFVYVYALIATLSPEVKKSMGV